MLDQNKLQYNLKHPHQISQGSLPTVGQIQSAAAQLEEEAQMRATLGKITKPKISRIFPKEFAPVTGFSKVKS